MYDTHYDLLTYIYMNKHNTKEVKEYCTKIFESNIKGGIFNLFYMSRDEMQKELNITANEIDIIENLRTVKELIEKEELIPKDINYIIGIEGLDYLKRIDDIDILYNLGVRSVNIVWNNHNKYGSGVRPYKVLNIKKGLTALGRELVYKLIKTGIAIDVSHSDENTFWDIVAECKKYRRLEPKILASHSNCKAICNVPRNLKDEQITAIKELNGIIGIVSIKDFCSKDTDVDYKKEYIRHIKHITQLLNGVENIAISTDNMDYYKIEKEYYKSRSIFKHESICKELSKLLLKNGFNKNEVEQIMEKNYERFFESTL